MFTTPWTNNFRNNCSLEIPILEPFLKTEDSLLSRNLNLACFMIKNLNFCPFKLIPLSLETSLPV